MSAELTWFGQAEYMISSPDCLVLIDPYFSNSLANEGFIRLYDSPVKKGSLKVNYVISTHHHSDHMDRETLRDYITFEKFYGPQTCIDLLKTAGFPSEKISSFNRGDKIKLGKTEVTAVFADHTLDSIGIVVECEGVKLYFTGGSLMNKELFAVKNLTPDILLTCINGKFGNMTWQEAVVFAHRLSVKLAIPAHYDLFALIEKILPCLRMLSVTAPYTPEF
jgi:L-ascorbate 6-phosphate lactonase